MATLGLTFPAGTVPTAVTLTSLTGTPAAATPMPVAFAGPTTLPDGRNRWVATFLGAGTYAYAVAAVIGGATRTLGGTVAGDVGSSYPTCPYATLADLQQAYGAKAIADWSDTDGTGIQDDGKVQAALTLAAADVVGCFFEAGNYATPLQPIGSDVVVVTDWVVRLARKRIYGVRSQGSEDPVTIEIEADVARVMAEMAARASRSRPLNAVSRWPTPSAPTGSW